jgi:AcrR family transcriptional regulator
MARRGRPPKPRAPRPRPPRREAARPTFEAVVEAAERVLQAHGIPGLTTNRVAEVAGVSISSLYHFFPNKEALASAVFDRVLDRFQRAIVTELRAAASLEDATFRVGAQFIALSAPRPALYAQLWRLRTTADAHERIAAHHRVLIDEVAAMLIRLAIMPAADARAHAFVVVHAVDGIVNAFGNDPTAVDPASLAPIFARLLRGIGA